MFEKYYAKHQSHPRPNPLTPFPTRKGGIQSLSLLRLASAVRQYGLGVSPSGATAVVMRVMRKKNLP
ncbi:hypothetical protein NIES4103_10560 [Nostoc sp. NIES-4103]|nr:hypothetical protein NIES4103_10560 [Nostoc sp. NIES-4103]